MVSHELPGPDHYCIIHDGYSARAAKKEKLLRDLNCYVVSLISFFDSYHMMATRNWLIIWQVVHQREQEKDTSGFRTKCGRYAHRKQYTQAGGNVAYR